MSVPETSRNKRRVKKKSQNDYTSDFSNNSQSHGMTLPPVPTVFDPAIERRRSSEDLQTTRNLPADIDNILPTVNKKINDNIGDIDLNNNDNKENQIDQTDDIGVIVTTI